MSGCISGCVSGLLLAPILPGVIPGIVKRDQCTVDIHRGAGDVIVTRCYIISKVDNITSASTSRDCSIGVCEVGDGISFTCIQ